MDLHPGQRRPRNQRPQQRGDRHRHFHRRRFRRRHRERRHHRHRHRRPLRTGTDDAPAPDADNPSTITGDTTGAVTEGDNPTIEAQDHAGTYGALAVLEGGAWTYTLDNEDPETNALGGGETVTDTFTVAASDGATVNVVITVTGADDAPPPDADDAPAPDADNPSAITGAVVEDDPASNTASGALSINDPDDGDNPIIEAQDHAGT